MSKYRNIFGKIVLAVLCLCLLLTTVRVTAFADQEDVDAVIDMLEEIDSLQQMQNKRSTFTVSGKYDADDPANVQEHQNAQTQYKEYVKEMFEKRDAAQTAFDALTAEEQNQIPSNLKAKLTDTLGTTFRYRTNPFALVQPKDDTYNYQMVQISDSDWYCYELSMHTSQDLDMPCILMVTDTSTGAATFQPDGEYSYGDNNYELTYCCDELEPTRFQKHYKRTNLEDCTYFNSYQASKVRAIILNAYPFVPLEDMIADLKDAGLTHADELDRADIIAAVQFAVWFFSNRMTNSHLIEDTSYGYTANAIDYARPNRPLIYSYHDYRNELWYWWNTVIPSDYHQFDWAYDADADARVMEVFNYLVNLPGVEASGNQFVISDIQITRTNMVEGSDNTYTIGLNILLNHGAAAGDEVILQISTSPDFPEDDTQTIDVTGQTTYSIDVTAQYGDTVFVKAAGLQYLDKSAYFYDPYGGYDQSQALVGVAEGKTRVKAANSFEFQKDIEAGIRIYKTEEETDKPIEGIQFSVYAIPASEVASLSDKPTEEEVKRFAVADNLVDTMTTDSTGYSALELSQGTYLLIEEPNEKVKAPVNPMYVTLPTEDDTVNPDIAELHLKNKPGDEPGTVSVDLSATKEFEDWGKAETFRFELEAVTEGAPMPEETIAVATEEEPEAFFDSILFVEPGTYEYTITEINDGVEGVTYDTTPHKVVVVVTEETVPHATEEDELESYALVADVTYDEDESLIITNTYAPAEASIDVSKLLEGRDWKDADSFEVTLKAVTKDAPMPEKTTLTLTKDAQKGTFGPLVFEKAGTYEYTVTETAGTEEGMIYDVAEHKVTVVVTKADDATNALTAKVTYGSGSSVEIKNTFEEETTTEEETTAPKTGDPAHAGMWWMIAVFAVFLIGVMIALGWKRKENK